jgi:hypothetical protein
MVPRRGRWAWPVAVAMATVVAACGSSGHPATTAHHGLRSGGTGSSASSGQPAPPAQDAAHADGTATVGADVSQTALPHGWTACPATATQDAAAVAPATPGCGFARAAEVQVQELLHNEGSTVFNTPESIGVSQPGHPQRLVNCVAQHNGPTIVCSDNGAPWVLVFRPPGQ